MWRKQRLFLLIKRTDGCVVVQVDLRKQLVVCGAIIYKEEKQQQLKKEKEEESCFGEENEALCQLASTTSQSNISRDHYRNPPEAIL